MRVYTVEHEIAALNPAAGDGLLVIENAADQVVQLIRACLYNMETDTHEMLVAGVFPITTKGSIAGGGSAPTPRKHDAGDTASAVTVYEAGNAGLATEPTTWGDPFDEQGFSNLSGYEWEPPFDSRPVLNPSALAGVRLTVAPSAAFRAKIILTFGEIGG